MDKFVELLVPDLSQLGSRGTTPLIDRRDEIRSPSFDFPRSNSRRLNQRKKLFETTEEMLNENPDVEDAPAVQLSKEDTQTDDKISPMVLIISPLKKESQHNSSLLSEDLHAMRITNDSTTIQEDKSNSSSLCRIIEEFEICPIHRGTVHSSPKLVTSHFEDSGFMNCSIEMPSRLELQNSFEANSSRKSEDASLNRRVSFDSQVEEGKGEDHYSSILENENPKRLSSRDKLADDKLPVAEMNDRKTWSAKNLCERDASPEKSAHGISANKKSTSSVHKCNSIRANNVSFESKGNCIIFNGATSDAINKSETVKPSRFRSGLKKMSNHDTRIYKFLAASTSTMSEEAKGYHLVNASEDISVIESVDAKSARNRKKISKIMIFD